MSPRFDFGKTAEIDWYSKENNLDPSQPYRFSVRTSFIFYALFMLLVAPGIMVLMIILS